MSCFMTLSHADLHQTLRTLQKRDLKHLHNVEKRIYCPQAFLRRLDFQCRDDISELK